MPNAKEARLIKMLHAKLNPKRQHGRSARKTTRQHKTGNSRNITNIGCIRTSRRGRIPWRITANDLVLQLRKRGMSKVILGGMLANMCVESHLRDLLEQGFEVLVARDATAGPRHPEWGYGYTAALVNFNFLAHAVRYTDDVVGAMNAR